MALGSEEHCLLFESGQGEPHYSKGFFKGRERAKQQEKKEEREWETAVDLRVRTLTGAELLRRREQNTRLEK